MRIKPFTAETQRHRENIENPLSWFDYVIRGDGLGPTQYICQFLTLPFSVSLCLCGGFVFGVEP